MNVKNEVTHTSELVMSSRVEEAET